MLVSTCKGPAHYFFETPHGNPPKHVLMVHTLYIDESRQSEPSQVTVLGGFRGTEDQWNDFIPKWKKALGQRPHLHMHSLRWNNKHKEGKIRSLLERLGPMPYECGLTPVYGAARFGDYSDMLERVPRIQKMIASYYLCLSGIFTVLMETVPRGEQVKIVSEKQDTYEPLASALLKAFSSVSTPDAYPELVSIEFVKKNATNATDPADYLAFALNHFWNEPGGKKDLLCRPIHGWGFPFANRPGMFLGRDIARQTIIEVMRVVLVKEIERRTALAHGAAAGSIPRQ